MARTLIAVSVIPSSGARWLVPRLGRFMDCNPQIDVRISASERLIDFGNRAVRPRHPLRFRPLSEPVHREAGGRCLGRGVCPSAVAAARAEGARRSIPAKLLCDDHPNGWETWFAAMAERGSRTFGSSVLTDPSMLVEAALRGQGVALARWSLAWDELANGYSYRCSPSSRGSPPVCLTIWSARARTCAGRPWPPSATGSARRQRRCELVRRRADDGWTSGGFLVNILTA